jgi:hypothetical protein
MPEHCAHSMYDFPRREAAKRPDRANGSGRPGWPHHVVEGAASRPATRPIRPLRAPDSRDHSFHHGLGSEGLEAVRSSRIDYIDVENLTFFN